MYVCAPVSLKAPRVDLDDTSSSSQRVTPRELTVRDVDVENLRSTSG
jgi:hypothetical protein